MRGKFHIHTMLERNFMFYSLFLAEHLNPWVLFFRDWMWRWKSVLMLKAFALHVWVQIWIFHARRDHQSGLERIFVAFPLIWRFGYFTGPPLAINLAFIADFCNFLSLFFIMNCSLKFFGISCCLLEAMDENELKENFLDGCGRGCIYKKEISLLLFSISCWAFKKPEEVKERRKLNEFHENNEIRIRMGGGGRIHLILNKDINETGAGWKKGTSN